MAKNIILLLVSILPVIIIGTYIYKKDQNKEPLGILVKLFLGGVASTIIVLIVSGIVFSIIPSLDIKAEHDYGFISLFIKMFFGVAIIEEGSKWLMTYVLSYNSKHFDEYYDIVLFSVFIALGFACFENILYVFSRGLTTGILRAFTAVPAHCFFGTLMGEYLGLAKISESNNNKKLRNKNMILSIILPALFHCTYNTFASFGNTIFIIVFFVIVILGYIRSIIKIKKIAKLSVNKYHVNYCSNCGTKISGNYCSNCGKKCF